MDEPLKRRTSLDMNKNEKRTENPFSLKNYFRMAHVHGMKYLGRKDKCESWFWLAILLLASSLAIIFVALSVTSTNCGAIIENKLSPVPINALPFPALTICSETKAQSSLVNFTDMYHEFNKDDPNGTDYSDDEISKLEALTQVCDEHLLRERQLKSNPTPGKDFANILREISPSIDFLLFCKFRGKIEADCSKFFKEVITDDGICYTFNMLEHQEMFKSDESDDTPSWDIETGYESDSGDYPFRAYSGAINGFNVVLDAKSSDLDFICRGPVQGFKYKIHPPNEFPRMSEGYHRISLNSDTLVSVEAKMSSNPDQAGSTCHSPATKTLKYFDDYSHSKCMDECFSDYVLSKCSCVKFSMVHGHDTEICNQHQTSCVSNATWSFLTTQHSDDFPCDCLPNCNNLKYKTTISQADFDFKRTIYAFREDLEEFPQSIMSRLTVYMEEDFYEPSVYSSQHSTIDFVAKIGGILAFFLGASCISIVEVFFYLFRRFAS